MLSGLHLQPEGMIRLMIFLAFLYYAYGAIGAIGAAAFRSWRLPAYTTRESSETEENKKRLFSHLDLLLRSTSKSVHRHAVSQFITQSVMIFISAYVLLLMGYRGGEIYQGGGLKPAMLLDPRALLLAILLGLLPYGYRRMRLMMIRRENSYALIDQTEKLLMKYRVPSGQADFYQSLYTLANEAEGSIKRTFMNMVTILQIEGKGAIHAAVELFTYQVQGSWSRQLGVLFIKAAKEGRNIEKALEKVHSDMVESKRIVEEEKSQYSDSILMGFFPIVLVPIAIFGINAMFDGAILKIIFQYPKAFQALVLCVLSIPTGLVTSFILSKPKIEV
ncbi:hypothetical protein PghCCS26_46240 [Paenibacillus glycanilyticus]|uniref:Type II secretion system protein GspF domain-containing protein n=1 Tax=Paenibacillus glycanilyticus TaxID=126569 RepID=A0ABQ6NSK6_9BACL|nr:hypothetical protein [Paenibacillus glycanilyticus]GMK47494.1 hypothetical protein PghCCS26_46240 [Paenibacillus glycanilyticus]